MPVDVQSRDAGTTAATGSGSSGFQGRSGTHRSLAGWFAHRGWRHLVAWVVLVFALFPVYWVVIGSLNPAGSLASSKLIPEQISLDNYRALLTEDGHPAFWTWFRNSMVVATVTATLTVTLAAFAAFAFSRMRFKGRRSGLLGLLLIQMFPAAVAVTAIYLLLQKVGEVFPAFGLGTLPGLIVVYLGGAMGLNAWMIKGFFDTIPFELDESAKVDGATHSQIFVKVVLPLGVPILAVVFLLSFIMAINELILAETLLRGNEGNYTLAVGLSAYVNAGFDSRWGPFAAGSLIASVPVLIVFFALQRYIVSGLTAGAVKG